MSCARTSGSRAPGAGSKPVVRKGRSASASAGAGFARTQSVAASQQQQQQGGKSGGGFLENLQRIREGIGLE